jgi:hypothetical protein
MLSSEAIIVSWREIENIRKFSVYNNAAFLLDGMGSCAAKYDNGRLHILRLVRSESMSLINRPTLKCSQAPRESSIVSLALRLSEVLR